MKTIILPLCMLMLLVFSTCSQTKQEKSKPSDSTTLILEVDPQPADEIINSNEGYTMDSLLSPPVFLKSDNGAVSLVYKKHNKWKKVVISNDAYGLHEATMESMQLNNIGQNELIIETSREHYSHNPSEDNWSTSYKLVDIYDLDADSIIFSIYKYNIDSETIVSERDQKTNEPISWKESRGSQGCKIEFKDNTIYIDSVTNYPKEIKKGKYTLTDNKLTRVN